MTHRHFYDIKEYLRPGDCLVINNTNVKKQYRDEYRNLVRKYNPYIVCILLNTDVDTCKERRKGLMPLTVIDKMAKNFDYPNPSEYDEIIIV